MIYRHKPFEFNAAQYDGTPEMNRKIIKASKHSKTPVFLDRSGPKISGDDLMAAGVLTIPMPEGNLPVSIGDYVAEGKDGNWCAFPQAYFEGCYEPLLPPEPVSSIIMPGLGARLN